MFLHDVPLEEWNGARAKANGFARKLSEFDTYFTFKLVIFMSRLEAVHEGSSQKQTSSRLDQTEKMARVVRASLSEFRKRGFSLRFWNETEPESHELELDVKHVAAAAPRHRKNPRRFDDGSVPYVFPLVDDIYRQRSTR